MAKMSNLVKLFSSTAVLKESIDVPALLKISFSHETEFNKQKTRKTCSQTNLALGEKLLDANC